MRAGRILIAAVLAALFVPLAQAQETGTLMPKRAAQIQGRGKDAARRAMEDFATCLVSRSAVRASKIANVPDDTPEFTRQYRALFETYDDCISGGELAFSTSVFRGALFQALYAKEFKSNAPTSFDPMLDSGYRSLYSQPLSPTAQSSIALESFGECVARADPQNVRALLDTIPGSISEDGYFKGLMPRYTACITKDNKISFSKTILKGVLAEALYRLSVASKNGAPKR